MKRGEIYYINRSIDDPEVGREIHSGRPAIIMSCTWNSPTAVVIYLTTQEKADVPTHVTINSARKPSTALVEQITTVDVDRVGDYCGTCTDQEMQRVEIAVAIALGIDFGERDIQRITRVEAERDAYKALVKEMIGANAPREE